MILACLFAPKIEKALLEDPQVGDVIEGTGGAGKMRIQLEERSKSGGGGVIYLDVFEQKNLYLLFAYPKNVQENLTPEQKHAIKKMIEAIRKEQPRGPDSHSKAISMRWSISMSSTAFL